LPAPRSVESVFAPKVANRIAALANLASQPGRLHLAATAANISGGPAAMAAHWFAATPPTPALDAALDALDQQWIDLWVAITGVDAASPALRASIATRLYGPAPDGFGHRRCRDAHPVDHAAGVVRALPAIHAVLASHNLRSHGVARVHSDDFLAAAAAIGAPSLPTLDASSSTVALVAATTRAAEAHFARARRTRRCLPCVP
jgi:hypothetical protein